MSFMMMPFRYMNDDMDSPTSSEEKSDKQESQQKESIHWIPLQCSILQWLQNIFFRRTIVNGKRFICLTGRDCLEGTEPIVTEKRMCRACRFAKCIEVGMNPTAIRTAVKTEEGRHRLSEVVKRQQQYKRIERKMESQEDFLAKMIEKLRIAEDHSQDLRSLSDILSQEPVFDVHRIPDLTPALKKRLKHTCMSYMHSALLASVELSKTYDFSSKLDLNSKLILLKHVGLIGSIMMSASYSMHNRKSDELIFPDGSVVGFMLDQLTGDKWSRYRLQIQKTLHAFLSNNVDRIEYILLKAVMMSNPALSDLSEEDQQVLEVERNLYGRALLSYCILQHGSEAFIDTPFQAKTPKMATFEEFELPSTSSKLNGFPAVFEIPDNQQDLQSYQKRSSSPPELSSPFSDDIVYKSLPRNKCPSKCLVCRNPAIGYHYDVPSCNGCKTFFRRTIITGRKFMCNKTKNCLEGTEPVDMSKRLCRACRFAKCVESGMNPLAIQAEVKTTEGKALRNEVINKRQSMGVVSSLMITDEDLLSRMIEKLTLVESKVEPLHRSGLPPGFRDVRMLEEVLDAKPIFVVTDIPNLKFCPPHEHKRKHMHIDIPEQNHNHPIRKHTVNYVHSSFLATVEASKLFDFSSQLDLASRMILIKHATVVCSNMMNAFFSIHQMKSDVLLHPDGAISGPMRKRDRYANVISDHIRLLQKTLIAFLSNKVDKIEYLLFKAIMLCNPAVSGLSLFDQQVIEKNGIST
ncbi:unnamed protein product [Caenorhabditis sp. 36 PRJEB53466]|nr:unnamed protein product [Caenorhabditis sp. 36 PRJEB53466]